MLLPGCLSLEAPKSTDVAAVRQTRRPCTAESQTFRRAFIIDELKSTHRNFIPSAEDLIELKSTSTLLSRGSPTINVAKDVDDSGGLGRRRRHWSARYIFNLLCLGLRLQRPSNAEHHSILVSQVESD